MSESIVRVITSPVKNNVYIRNSSIHGQYEGVFMDIWRSVAENLHLSYKISTIPVDIDDTRIGIINKMVNLVPKLKSS